MRGAGVVGMVCGGHVGSFLDIRVRELVVQLPSHAFLELSVHAGPGW